MIGIPLLRFWGKGCHRSPLGRDVLICLFFSVASVASVLLFASFESILSGDGFRFGAVSTYGVYLIAPLFLFPVFRKNIRQEFDRFAVYVLPSLFLQRLKCLASGCCFGRQIPGTQLSWPVREIELAFYFFVLIWFFYRKKKKPIISGGMFPLLMAFYGATRFFLEFFRGDNGPGLFHLSHVWSVLSIILGLSIFIELNRKNMPDKNIEKKKKKSRK